MDIGEWWTAFYEGDITERELLLTTAVSAPGPKRKRAPRRGNRSKGSGGAGAPQTANEE